MKYSLRESRVGEYSSPRPRPYVSSIFESGSCHRPFGAGMQFPATAHSAHSTLKTQDFGTFRPASSLRL